MSKKLYELGANDEVTTPADLSGKQDVLEYDASPTQNSTKMVKSGGIFTWVKGLLPNWLTSSYAEPATVSSVNAKYTKPSGGIPSTDLASGVVSNATITLTQGGVNKGSFNLNQSSGSTIALDAGSSGGGVTKIVAGSNVTISPTSGTGEVTINASGGGGSGGHTVFISSIVGCTCVATMADGTTQTLSQQTQYSNVIALTFTKASSSYLWREFDFNGAFSYTVLRKPQVGMFRLFPIFTSSGLLYLASDTDGSGENDDAPSGTQNFADYSSGMGSISVTLTCSIFIKSIAAQHNPW